MSAQHSTSRTLRRWREVAPVLAIAAIVILPTVSGYRAPDRSMVHQRVVGVMQAIDRAPFTIGAWHGEPVPVPPAARELLRTPAILGRQFEIPGDARGAVGIYVVHCSDARDMGAHYPPVCYRAQGWSRQWEEGAPAPTCTVSFGGAAVQASIYDFRREEPGVGTRSRTVLNFFVRPTGETFATLPAYNRLLERYVHGARGVSQVHVDFVHGERWSRDEMVAAANELLGGLGDLAAEMGLGGKRDRIAAEAQPEREPSVREKDA